ncbi:MAG TPA: hypothetical protein VGR82_17620 [Methylomirabilota bacterium]|jgi:hypothetical protein|nr:hypothetical protein [Methylomirabilota bacterium]
MSAAKQETFGPVFIANAAGNLVAPAAAGAGGVGYTATADVLFIKHIRIVNKTAGAVTYTLYKGATGGSASGTEVVGAGKSVAANSAEDMYFSPALRLEGANGFLTGVAGSANALVFTAEGEVSKV